MRRLRGLFRAGVVVLLFSLLYTAFFSPVLFSGRLLAPGDGLSLNLPHYYSPVSLWSIDLFSGFPVMADPQNMFWYPPARLLSWIPHSWNVFVLSAYVLASSFTFGYVYQLTRSWSAAVVGGLVYGLSGFFMSHLGHTNVIHSVAWMPLLIWSLEELRRQLCPIRLLIAGVATAQSAFAGHPQFFVYTLGLGAAYVILLCRRAPLGTGPFLVASLGGVLLGVGLAAVLLVPMFELQRYSVRASLPFREFVSYCLPAQELPRLFFPYCCGGFWNPVSGTYTPCFAGGGGMTEATGYVGLLPLLLAGFGLVFGRERNLVWFWGGVAVASLLLALGARTPLPYLLQYLPVYNKFRIPARHFVHLALAVSVLAGFGVAALPRLPLWVRLRALRRGSVGIMSAAVVLGAMFLICYARGAYTKDLPSQLFARSPVLSWHNPALVAPVTVLALGLLTTWYWCRRSHVLSQTLLLAAVTLDLASFGWFCEWHQARVTESDIRLPAGLLAYRERLQHSGQRLAPFNTGFGPQEGAEAGAPPNRSRLWHVPSVVGYSPLLLTRYSQFLGVDYTGRTPLQCLRPDDRSLDLLSVRVVLVARSLLAAGQGVPGLADTGRWSPLEDLGAFRIFENHRALPRAWVVPRVLPLEPDAILDAVRGSRLPDGTAFDPRTVALVEEPVTVSTVDSQERGSTWDCKDPGPARDTAQAAGTVRLLHLSDTEVELESSCQAPAFLVLSDIYYPGWQAWVNETAAPIYRTDFALRGVPIPAGQSRVRFAFRPWSFYAGTAATSLSALVGLGLLFAGIRSRLVNPGPPGDANAVDHCS